MSSDSSCFRHHNDLIEARKLFDELRDEVDAAYIALDADERSSVLRRGVIRSGLAYLDAALDYLKVQVRRSVDDPTYADELTDAEFDSLDTARRFWDANPTGITLEVDFILIFELAAKIWHLDSSILSPGSQARQALRRINITRQHLMRPRQTNELEIEAIDLQSCSVAVTWVSAKLHRIMHAASALAPRLDYLGREKKRRSIYATKQRREPPTRVDLVNSIFATARNPSAPLGTK